MHFFAGHVSGCVDTIELLCGVPSHAGAASKRWDFYAISVDLFLFGMLFTDCIIVSEGANTMDIGRTILLHNKPRHRLDAGNFDHCSGVE